MDTVLVILDIISVALLLVAAGFLIKAANILGRIK